MSAKGEHARRSGFPVFAVILIVAGVVLLLWNFGALPQGVWRQLWKFWPAILLIIGVSAFLRDRPWLSGLVVLLIMLVCIGAAVWLAHGSPSYTMSPGFLLAAA